ncbi:MAG: di-heme oxidoredictase family protein [Planctomycetaceae bacterium]
MRICCHPHCVSMTAFFAVTLTAVSAGFAQFPAQKVVPDPRPKVERLREGRALFVRDWKKQGKLNKTGDGLGPVYNAASCVACHSQQGIGGAGPDEHNVDLLSLATRKPTLRPRFSTKYIQTAQKRVHPGFSASRTSVVLHKFGPAKSEKGKPLYATFRDGILGESTPRMKKQRERALANLGEFNAPAPKGIAARQYFLTRERRYRRVNRIPVEFTQRNTPALFGAGIIDAIPDSAILAAADKQKRIRGISGRVPQTSTGAIGRFGWRGQTATLHDFVLGACANELGLEVPGQAQPLNPLTQKPGQIPASVPFPSSGAAQKTLDLTDRQCRSLTEFVVSLPAPMRARKVTLEVSRQVRDGERVFSAIGCATCHLPSLGPAKGVYSDLLLHDMGPKLADPLSAIPEITERTAPGFSGSFGYYGGEALPQIAKITTNIRQEWRTPPLWGVADSAPYLHDGRAATLEKAILLHGGEGAAAAKRYRRLKGARKDRLVLFLASLVAPGSPTQPTLPARGGFGASGGFFSAPVDEPKR